MRINVTGPLTLSQAALPGMLERGSGVIITVASYSVVSPGPPGERPTAPPRRPW